MSATEYIRQHGFRRWYERQLIESHAYLALGFVALVMLLAGAELLGDAQSGSSYVFTLAAAALGGVLVVVAWTRFNALLKRAERFAEGASCPACKAWGKFRVISQEATSEDDPPEAGRPHWLRVRCAQCGGEWKIG